MTTKKPKSKAKVKPKKTPEQIHADKVKAGKARYESARKDKWGRLLSKQGHSKSHGKPPARNEKGRLIGRSVDERDLGDILEKRFGGGREDKGDTFETKGFNANVLQSKYDPNRFSIILEHTRRKGRPLVGELESIFNDIRKNKDIKAIIGKRRVQICIQFDAEDADDNYPGSHGIGRWRPLSNAANWDTAIGQAIFQVSSGYNATDSRRYRVQAVEIIIY